MAVASKPAAVAVEATEAAPEPAPQGPAAAAKAVPIAERELQPKALLRVRADIVDRLVNEAGEDAIAPRRIEGEMRAMATSSAPVTERKSTRPNSRHLGSTYAAFCLKTKTN